jgi:ABC-2 type transport system permease protein
MKAIYKKEMQGYFTSMIAYFFMAAFVLIIGIYFTYYCVSNAVTDFSGYVLPSTCMWFILLIPIVTMRMWSEERKQKTDQLLLTSPISVTKIVFGKYLAVATLLLLTLCIVLLFPFMLHFYGTVTWATVFTGMFGYFLVGCSLLAVGFFISSLTEHQVVSAVCCGAVIFVLFFMSNLADMLPGRARYSITCCALVVVVIMVLFYLSTKKVLPSVIVAIVGAGIIAAVYYFDPTIYDNGISNFVNWFSIIDRYTNFTDGILDVGSIVYYLSFIGVFLYLTVYSIEKKRWN